MTNFKLTLDYVGTYASKSNTNYTFYVKARTLKKELLEWIEVNPRLQKMNIVNKIRQSAIEAPNDFVNKNNGIFLSVDMIAVRGDNKVDVHFTDKNIHGILNGGHTYRALSSIQQQEYDELEDDVIVTVNIISGIKTKDTIVPIAIAMNDGEKVTIKSVMNLKSHFDLLKDTLSVIGYDGKVSYKQNESRNLVEVVDIIKLLSVFDVTEEKPWSVMNGLKNIFDYYERNLVGGESSFMYKLIKYQLIDLFEVYSYVEENIHLWYEEFCNSFDKRVSLNTAVGVNVLDKNDKSVRLASGFPCVTYNKEEAIYPSLFNKEKLIKTKVPAPFVFVVCRALNIYIKEVNGIPRFSTDVIKLLEENKELRHILIKQLLKEIAKLGWNNITVTAIYKKGAEDVWKSVSNEVLSFAYRTAL